MASFSDGYRAGYLKGFSHGEEKMRGRIREETEYPGTVSHFAIQRALEDELESALERAQADPDIPALKVQDFAGDPSDG